MPEFKIEARSERPPPAAVIVQVPPSWRQPIQNACKHAAIEIPVEVREGISSAGIHPTRQPDLQAEQTLTLAADATYQSGSTGCAIVCDESGDRISMMIAAHDEQRTELYGWQGWNRTESADAIDYVLFLLERWSRHAPEIRGPVPQSRFAIDRAELFAGAVETRPVWRLSRDRKFEPEESTEVAGVLPGSFHPLHRGHRKMRRAAEEILSGRVVYEMTLQNADKPPLDWLTLCLRSRQFSADDLLLTRVPTFGEKAELFPGTTFVVGWDTAARVLERRFYPDGRLESSLEKIAGRECRFLVAARRYEGGLRTVGELTIPSRFRDLFSAIPPEVFEEDVSSTSIREAWLRGESETGPPGLFTHFFEND